MSTANEQLHLARGESDNEYRFIYNLDQYIIKVMGNLRGDGEDWWQLELQERVVFACQIHK